MELLPVLLGTAVLLPLISFFLILCFGNWMGKAGIGGAYVATSAIVGAGVLSFVCLIFLWLPSHPPSTGHGGHDETEHHDSHPAEPHAEPGHAHHSAPAGGVPASLASFAEDHGEDHGHDHGHAAKIAYTGDYYVLGKFGDLRVTISYYIDSLTICMFCMVTLIASCIHFYAIGYMHDELHDITDHEVTLSDGSHLTRPGRFPRFFQYLSLFCFSMLGLVLAGNIAMVFVFWELVGVCSYFLIGFYVERKSASNAANKAFIANRVGDFGMIIGLMALWAGCGTFAFGDIDGQPGIFSQVRPDEHHHPLGQAHAGELIAPDGMVKLAAREKVAEIVRENPGLTTTALDNAVQSELAGWRAGENNDGKGFGYGLLLIGGLGIFCGCVGKSAQFPLHVCLPDAMQGPTPLSSLVHSATMGSAGVYLVARFFPVFAPEVLLVIAIVGCITLFIGATIAITATDIKRVLAYSTISQLGYMMLALGVGGWLAGLLHLITHAFFKSLLFMCSGSVIHAVHSNEMTEMGGLRKKMPVTAYTMLIGCLAIAGISIPFVVGFSGYSSKDAILEQAYAYMGMNTSFWGALFFCAAAGGAAITAFYMFRMWYMTFAGKPKNQERYDHAHESPKVMYLPLILLSVFATTVAWTKLWPEALVGVCVAGLISAYVLFRPKTAEADHGHDDHHDHGHDHDRPSRLPYVPIGLTALVLVVSLFLADWSQGTGFRYTLKGLLEQSRPDGIAAHVRTTIAGRQMTWPDEHWAHLPAQLFKIVVPVTLLATATALLGIALATVMYCWGKLNPDEARKQFRPIYSFLVNKWWFDELYEIVFIKPTHVVSGWLSAVYRGCIDWLIDNVARLTRRFADAWDWLADRTIVDGLVNLLARCMFATGLSLRRVQTGSIRQYVMFIVIASIAIFVLISFFWNPTLAG